MDGFLLFEDAFLRRQCFQNDQFYGYIANIQSCGQCFGFDVFFMFDDFLQFQGGIKG